MGLFLHRDAGDSRAKELHPLPHGYRAPETPPLSGEGECEICGREREDIVHVMQRGSVMAGSSTELAEEFHWPDN